MEPALRESATGQGQDEVLKLEGQEIMTHSLKGFGTGYYENSYIWRRVKYFCLGKWSSRFYAATSKFCK